MLRSSDKKIRFPILVLSALCLGSLLTPSYADPDLYRAMENTYIGVSVGCYGHWDEIPDPFHRTTDDKPIAGRFGLWNVGGDPETTDDDNTSITYVDPRLPISAPCDRWGAVQVMIDGYLEDGSHVWAPFEEGGLSGIWGDEVDGVWAIEPYKRTDDNIITGTWYPVSTEEDLNTLGGTMPIRVQQDVKLLGDTCRFEWTITNQDVRDHLVGLRIYTDNVLGGEDSGTVDLRNIVSIPGHPLLEDKIILQGSEIPPVLEMFNASKDPVQSIRFTFSGNGATTPDVVGIDDWFSVANVRWTYNIVPGALPDPFMAWAYEPPVHQAIGDLAYGAYWKPRRLMPGQTRTIVHYIGLACASQDMTNVLSKPTATNLQYCARVQGPRTLKYYSDSGVSKMYPEPFTVTATLENVEKKLDITNVGFTLILPPGLQLDPSETKYTKTLTRVIAQKSGTVSWKVRTVGNPTGILDYSVAFSGYPNVGTTVKRSISIPATENQKLAYRWQLFSVPFDMSNDDPQSALGLTGTYRLLGYDPVTMQWEEPVVGLVPGKAYYLWLSTPQSTNLTPGEFTPMDWEGNSGYQIPLHFGWNMVGNPFVYTITLGECRFFCEPLGVVNYEEAVRNGLIYPSVWAWDSTFQRWILSSKRWFQLKPWQGYWIRAKRSDVFMLVTPASQIGASVEGVPPVNDGGDNGGGDTPPTPGG